MPPAILTGWVDMVIRPGLAHEFLEGDCGEGVPRGLLQARRAIVFNTSNTLPEREQNDFGDPLQTIWRNRSLFAGKDSRMALEGPERLSIHSHSRRALFP